MVAQGKANHGKDVHKARRGVAGHCQAGRGKDLQGDVWHGIAELGWAGSGEPWQGLFLGDYILY